MSRLRNIPGSREAIAASTYVIGEDEEVAGKWSGIFGNDHPIRIEIGMGKGTFLMRMAQAYPEINFVGIEKYSSVLLRAVQKQEEEGLANLKFIRMEAEYIEEKFAPGEVERIYLNFSDPWPKDKHEKRRLTCQGFLKRYEMLLPDGGEAEFKTDNEVLFDFSLESAKEAGWELVASSRDLHKDSKLCEGNIMTEYEEKFVALGKKIYKMIIQKPHFY